MKSFLRAATAALLLFAAPKAEAVAPAPAGWTKIYLPGTQGYTLLYVPAGLDRSKPAPAVLFLHGSGSYPEPWRPFLAGPADLAGAVVVAPRSKGIGWEAAVDPDVIAEALDVAKARVLIEPRRISAVGHSAGGSMAVRTAYGLLHGQPSRLAGVFILSSPFVAIGGIADPGYVAPLRQYYGTDDPNYQSGARDLMRAQWERLGVPFEEQIESGYGHSNWPANTLPDGFAFLVRQIYPSYSDTCQPTATGLCLNGGRYRVTVAWRTLDAAGAGRPVAIASGDSGLFWFFAPGNVELLLKVLDGCAVNGRVWVFLSATTDVEFTVTVTDTVSAAVRTYSNALGHPATPVTDTAAFATCGSTLAAE